MRVCDSDTSIHLYIYTKGVTIMFKDVNNNVKKVLCEWYWGWKPLETFSSEQKDGNYFLNSVRIIQTSNPKKILDKPNKID